MTLIISALTMKDDHTGFFIYNGGRKLFMAQAARTLKFG
jgi:hypothetical protein